MDGRMKAAFILLSVATAVSVIGTICVIVVCMGTLTLGGQEVEFILPEETIQIVEADETTQPEQQTKTTPPPEPPVIGPDEPKPFERSTYDEAIERCKLLGEPFVVIFGAEWCAPCKELKQRISDLDLQGKLSGLRLVELDVDTDAGRDVAKRMRMPRRFTIPMVVAFQRKGDGVSQTRFSGSRVLEFLKGR